MRNVREKYIVTVLIRQHDVTDAVDAPVIVALPGRASPS